MEVLWIRYDCRMQWLFNSKRNTLMVKNDGAHPDFKHLTVQFRLHRMLFGIDRRSTHIAGLMAVYWSCYDCRKQ